jgi:flagellar motor protein MotB
MSDKDNGESNFSHSMTDLMTSLAIVFLILAVAMIVKNKLSEDSRASKYDALSSQNEKIKNSKTELLNELKKILEIIKQGNSFSTEDNCIVIDGDSSPYKIKIRLNGDNSDCKSRGLFYDDDSSFIKVTSKIEKTLNSLSSFYDALCSENFIKNIERVQILGHTDNKPSPRDLKNCILTVGSDNIKKLQCGNVNLSSSRAENVFLMLGNSIIKKNKETLINCYTVKTEISGRGPFDPDKKYNSDSPNQRRVEIVISLNQPKII